MNRLPIQHCNELKGRIGSSVRFIKGLFVQDETITALHSISAYVQLCKTFASDVKNLFCTFHDCLPLSLHFICRMVYIKKKNELLLTVSVGLRRMSLFIHLLTIIFPLFELCAEGIF